MPNALAGLCVAMATASIVSASARVPSTAWKEVYEGGSPRAEQAHFLGLAQEINAIQEQLAIIHHQPLSRAFHAKGHLVLHAEFQVLPDIPSYARYSLFRSPKTYQGIVRFSNGLGFTQPDSAPDVRGMALALEGPGGTHQDLLMTNSPVCAAKNADEFVKFAWSTLNLGTAPFTLIRSLGLLRGTEMAWFLLTSTSRPIQSLADERYWSGAPVKVGPYAAKFGVWPVKVGKPLSPPASGTDYLAADLDRRIKAHEIDFDFGLQFFVSERQTPIENAHKVWPESVAPFVTVARVRLPRQDPDSAAGMRLEAVGASLSFSPWHTFWPGTPDELRPLGNLMRARKAVYAASARLRGATSSLNL